MLTQIQSSGILSRFVKNIPEGQYTRLSLIYSIANYGKK